MLILAAFLGSLLCALAVSAIVRCAQRMGIDLSNDVSVVANAHTSCNDSHKGIKQSDMKALPSVVYSRGSARSSVIDCPICLADFMEGEKLRVLPQCNHCFHVECIDKWLACNPSFPSYRHCLLRVIIKLKSSCAETHVTQNAIDSETTTENH